MLVPVQIIGEVNSQELVAVHSLDLNMVHCEVQHSSVWTLASCAVENSINLVLRLLSVRLFACDQRPMLYIAFVIVASQLSRSDTLQWR